MCFCHHSTPLRPQVSYGIGLSQPLSVYVDTYKTGSQPDEDIQEAVMRTFDFRPGRIIQVCFVCLSVGLLWCVHVYVLADAK